MRNPEIQKVCLYSKRVKITEWESVASKIQRLGQTDKTLCYTVSAVTKRDGSRDTQHVLFKVQSSVYTVSQLRDLLKDY